MFTNRFYAITVLLAILIAAVTSQLRMNTNVQQESVDKIATRPSTYRPLSPDKQRALILINAVSEACLDGSQKALAAGPENHSDTYYPLPPGKQTILLKTARQACMDSYITENYLTETSGK